MKGLTNVMMCIGGAFGIRATTNTPTDQIMEPDQAATDEVWILTEQMSSPLHSTVKLKKPSLWALGS